MVNASDEYVFCGCGSTSPPVPTLRQRLQGRIPFLRGRGLLRCPDCDTGSRFRYGETPEAMRRTIDTVRGEQPHRPSDDATAADPMRRARAAVPPKDQPIPGKPGARGVPRATGASHRR